MRKLRWMAAAVVAMLVFGAFAGGCGDDDSGSPGGSGEETVQEELSNQRYAEELRATMIQLGNDLQAIDAASTPGSLSLSKRELESLGETIRRTVDEFGAIDPPGDAQEGHDRVLAALEDFSSKYNDLSETVQADGKVTEESFTALRTATFELQDQYLQARETLIDDGIDLGTPSSEG